MIGPQYLRRPLNQSDAKLKNNRVWSPAFSRASSSLSSHWLMTMQTLVLIGRLDTSGFGLFNIQLKTKEFALLVTQLLSL